MDSAKSLFAKIVMSVLTVILTSFAVLSNGFVLAIIARFKSMRTLPNILVANLAMADLLSAIINLPFHMISSVLEASWFSGKTLAIMTCILNRLFLVLNLTSMLAMMVDVYLAISFEIRYHVWKTIEKALLCVFLIWFISIATVMLTIIPTLDIDFGDAHVNAYRAEVFERAKYFVATFMALFAISHIVVYFLTARSIKKKRKEVFK